MKTRRCHRLWALAMVLMLASGAMAQTDNYDGHFTRSLSDVMGNVGRRFGVKFKYNVDTVGRQLPYADFRIRPYSLEQTLDNICKYFDFAWWAQGGGVYKIKPYEYARRHTEEGAQMLNYLASLYHNKEQFEARKDSVRREVRRLLDIDNYLSRRVKTKAQLTKMRRYDGYTVQNFSIETLPGEHIYGSIYAPTSKGCHALIVCPDGHFLGGRYRKDEQLRLATLARMGAVCVDFDLYGWGESEKEYGYENHRTERAHVVQAMNGITVLDYLLATRRDIDRRRIGVNGGSGGGTHTVLLSLIDDRFTAAAPTVNLASHFDGGCPCESGKPIQLAGGGTTNAELAAMFAPKPMQVVSDGGDWTASVPELEFPFLQRIYGFYGAKDKVENVHLPAEGHDYGPNKRKANYDFFARVFGLDRSKIDESKVTIVPENVLKSNPAK